MTTIQKCLRITLVSASTPNLGPKPVFPSPQIIESDDYLDRFDARLRQELEPAGDLAVSAPSSPTVHPEAFALQTVICAFTYTDTRSWNTSH